MTKHEFDKLDLNQVKAQAKLFGPPGKKNQLHTSQPFLFLVLSQRKPSYLPTLMKGVDPIYLLPSTPTPLPDPQFNPGQTLSFAGQHPSRSPLSVTRYKLLLRRPRTGIVGWGSLDNKHSWGARCIPPSALQ